MAFIANRHCYFHTCSASLKASVESYLESFLINVVFYVSSTSWFFYFDYNITFSLSYFHMVINLYLAFTNSSIKVHNTLWTQIHSLCPNDSLVGCDFEYSL